MREGEREGGREGGGREVGREGGEGREGFTLALTNTKLQHQYDSSIISGKKTVLIYLTNQLTC